MLTVRTVAFIGLGIMGRPMAANLVKAGFDVAGHSRRRESAEELLAAGGRWAPSVAAAVRDADAVITMLPDSPDVEAVALGPDGIVSNAPSGALHIDMSSIRPEVARRVAVPRRRAAAPPRCTVSGGERAPSTGFVNLVGGCRRRRCGPAPSGCHGARILHVGPAYAGQTVAANQLIVAGNIALVAEALVFLKRKAWMCRGGRRCPGRGSRGQHGADWQASSMLAGDCQPLPHRVARQGLAISPRCPRGPRRPPVGGIRLS